MFWRFGGYANISTIDTILDKPDFTLEELLDESDLIQELKQHNTKLIEYLREDKVLESLLDYVVAPKLDSPKPEADAAADTPADQDAAADDDDDSKAKTRILPFSRPRASSRATDPGIDDEEEQEKKRNRYAFVACEVLGSDTWSIYEALAENRQLIRNFWKFLSRPAPLDPLQASYFTKVNESLFEKKTEDMMELLMSLADAVPDLLRHVECPMIMDLLLKIIALDRSEGGQGVVEVCLSPIISALHPSNPPVCSGSIPRKSSHLFFPVSAPRTTGLFRRPLATSSKPSSPFPPTPLRMSSSALVRTSLLANWFPSLALRSLSNTCWVVATPSPSALASSSR